MIGSNCAVWFTLQNTTTTFLMSDDEPELWLKGLETRTVYYSEFHNDDGGAFKKTGRGGGCALHFHRKCEKSNFDLGMNFPMSYYCY